jgi:hypothetical protein
MNRRNFGSRPPSPPPSCSPRCWSATPVATPDGVRGRLTTAFADSTQKLGDLKDPRYSMRFANTTLLQDQSRVAVDALAKGVSRCVTIAYAGNEGQGWDTHANNDASQTVLWEGLFSGLVELMALLESTPGNSAVTLADETLVVVLSEMARTPNLNATNGKDHWPHTSALLIGPGITGNAWWASSTPYSARRWIRGRVRWTARASRCRRRAWAPPS